MLTLQNKLKNDMDTFISEVDIDNKTDDEFYNNLYKKVNKKLAANNIYQVWIDKSNHTIPTINNTKIIWIELQRDEYGRIKTKFDLHTNDIIGHIDNIKTNITELFNLEEQMISGAVDGRRNIQMAWQVRYANLKARNEALELAFQEVEQQEGKKNELLWEFKEGNLSEFINEKKYRYNREYHEKINQHDDHGENFFYNEGTRHELRYKLPTSLGGKIVGPYSYYRGWEKYYFKHNKIGIDDFIDVNNYNTTNGSIMYSLFNDSLRLLTNGLPFQKKKNQKFGLNLSYLYSYKYDIHVKQKIKSLHKIKDTTIKNIITDIINPKNIPNDKYFEGFIICNWLLFYDNIIDDISFSHEGGNLQKCIINNMNVHQVYRLNNIRKYLLNSISDIDLSINVIDTPQNKIRFTDKLPPPINNMEKKNIELDLNNYTMEDEIKLINQIITQIDNIKSFLFSKLSQSEKKDINQIMPEERKGLNIIRRNQQEKEKYKDFISKLISQSDDGQNYLLSDVEKKMKKIIFKPLYPSDDYSTIMQEIIIENRKIIPDDNLKSKLTDAKTYVVSKFEGSETRIRMSENEIIDKVLAFKKNSFRGEQHSMRDLFSEIRARIKNDITMGEIDLHLSEYTNQRENIKRNYEKNKLDKDKVQNTNFTSENIYKITEKIAGSVYAIVSHCQYSDIKNIVEEDNVIKINQNPYKCKNNLFSKSDKSSSKIWDLYRNQWLSYFPPEIIFAPEQDNSSNFKSADMSNNKDYTSNSINDKIKHHMKLNNKSYLYNINTSNTTKNEELWYSKFINLNNKNELNSYWSNNTLFSKENIKYISDLETITHKTLFNKPDLGTIYKYIRELDDFLKQDYLQYLLSYKTQYDKKSSKGLSGFSISSDKYQALMKKCMGTYNVGKFFPNLYSNYKNNEQYLRMNTDNDYFINAAQEIGITTNIDKNNFKSAVKLYAGELVKLEQKKKDNLSKEEIKQKDKKKDKEDKQKELSKLKQSLDSLPKKERQEAIEKLKQTNPQDRIKEIKQIIKEEKPSVIPDFDKKLRDTINKDKLLEDKKKELQQNQTMAEEYKKKDLSKKDKQILKENDSKNKIAINELDKSKHKKNKLEKVKEIISDVKPNETLSQIIDQKDKKNKSKGIESNLKDKIDTITDKKKDKKRVLDEKRKQLEKLTAEKEKLQQQQDADKLKKTDKLVNAIVQSEQEPQKKKKIEDSYKKIMNQDTNLSDKLDKSKQLLSKIADVEKKPEKASKIKEQISKLERDTPELNDKKNQVAQLQSELSKLQNSKSKNKLEDTIKLLTSELDPSLREDKQLTDKYQSRLQDISEPINKIDNILQNNDENTKQKIITELDKLKDKDNIDASMGLTNHLEKINKQNINQLVDVRDNLDKLRTLEMNKENPDQEYIKQLEEGIKILQELIDIEKKKLPELEIETSISKYREKYDELMKEKQRMDDRLKRSIEGNFDKRADYLYEINQYREKIENDMYELLSLIQNKKYELKLLQNYYDINRESEKQDMVDYKDKLNYKKKMKRIQDKESKLREKHNYETMKLRLHKSLMKKKIEDKDNDLLNNKKKNQLKLKSTKNKMKQLSQNKNFLKSIFSTNDNKKTSRMAKRNNKRNTIRK